MWKDADDFRLGPSRKLHELPLTSIIGMKLMRVDCRTQDTARTQAGGAEQHQGQAVRAQGAIGLASAGNASGSMDIDSLARGMSKLSSCDSEVPGVSAFGRRNRRRAFS